LGEAVLHDRLRWERFIQQFDGRLSNSGIAHEKIFWKQGWKANEGVDNFPPTQLNITKFV
jgi:hypothetical protein